MQIKHQGWNETVGTFHCIVTIDEEKHDHEIRFPDGSVFRQASPFEHLVADWEQTGHPYPVLGAFFAKNGAREFFTPLELASLVLNGYAEIPGLQIEDLRESLASRIQTAAQRVKSLAEIQPHGQDHTAPTR